MKKYNAAPLPFQGQKRGFAKEFKKKLQELPDHAVFVDLFGGSGLLSHLVKQEKPNAVVIWNDYDNFQQRLENIDNTNRLLAEIRTIMQDTPKEKKIPEHIKEEIIQAITSQNGYVDYITLSSNLLFSGKYYTTLQEFSKPTFYNNTTNRDYNADGYLSGVIRKKEDYRDILKDLNRSDIIIADPPYLTTDASAYRKDVYWGLTQHLDLIAKIKMHPFFLFSSNKSEIIELMTWLDNHQKGEYMQGMEVICRENIINHSSPYTDIMMYKKQA